MPSIDKNPIPIKNLFYMLCYAWNVLPIMKDIQVGSEDIEDAYNLLARVFTYGVSKLVRSGFHRSYIEREEELTSIKGRINIQQSINRMSIQNKKLVCDYDEYSSNDIFNQIIKYTIDSIIKNTDIEKETRHDLKNLSVFFEGIDSKEPNKENRAKLVFNRNNTTYRLLIQIAFMLYENSFINEETGKNLFKDFFREEQMHKVFEIFILNFYAMNLNRKEFKVHAPKINWHIEENAQQTWGEYFEVEENIGDRRTDIVVEDKTKNIQIIIDAKYYHKTFVKAHMGEDENSIRTGHLNQVRGYVIDSEFSGKKIGALFYPMTTVELNKGKVFPIAETPIIVKTINLADDWQKIHDDMLKFVEKVVAANS